MAGSSQRGPFQLGEGVLYLATHRLSRFKESLQFQRSKQLEKSTPIETFCYYVNTVTRRNYSLSTVRYFTAHSSTLPSLHAPVPKKPINISTHLLCTPHSRSPATITPDKNDPGSPKTIAEPTQGASCPTFGTRHTGGPHTSPFGSRFSIITQLLLYLFMPCTSKHHDTHS